MKSEYKPARLIVLASLILPATLGFSSNTETLARSNKVLSQAIILKPGKVSNEIFYARPHDSYYRLARRLGISARYLMSINNASSPYLKPRQPVILSRFIEPSTTSIYTGVIINLPEKKLYYFTNGRLLKTYGVAVGQPTWQTPTGNFSILYKTKAPDWHIPVSIQREMARKGKKVQKVVPAGPNNPLGNWWMAIASGIGIHSTNAPASIGYSVSHGCIRMKPASAAELFSRVQVRNPVKVIYQPVKVGVDKNNNVYLEAYRDMYSRNFDYTGTTSNLLKQNNLSGNINWSTVSIVLRSRSGVPVLISRVANINKNVTPPYIAPVVKPTIKPTVKPIIRPTVKPTIKPIMKPTPIPTVSIVPTSPPVIRPTVNPTERPIDINPYVTPRPTIVPTMAPASLMPTVAPTPRPIITPEPTAPLPTATPTENIIDNTHPR